MVQLLGQLGPGRPGVDRGVVVLHVPGRGRVAGALEPADHPDPPARDGRSGLLAGSRRLLDRAPAPDIRPLAQLRRRCRGLRLGRGRLGRPVVAVVPAAGEQDDRHGDQRSNERAEQPARARGQLSPGARGRRLVVRLRLGSPCRRGDRASRRHRRRVRVPVRHVRRGDPLHRDRRRRRTSASISSSQFWKRSSGSFSSILATTSARGRGQSGRSAVTGGAFSWRWAMTTATSSSSAERGLAGQALVEHAARARRCRSWRRRPRPPPAPAPCS